MKNIFRKYPKRITAAMLVILLVAVIGTVNNYRTYRNAGKPVIYLAEETVEYMNEIYGGVLIESGAGRSSLSYNGIELEANLTFTDLSKVASFTADAESYAPGDTVTVTLENKEIHNMEFYSGKYLMQVMMEDRWFTIHTGEINKDEFGEWTKLSAGESFVFDVPLSSIREVSDEAITLRAGEYRLCKEVTLKTRTDVNIASTWLACEFEIE